MQDVAIRLRRPAVGGILPTENDSAAAKHKLADLGEHEAAKQIGVSRHSLHKIAAGSPVRYGTLVVFRIGVGLIQVTK